QNKWTEEWGQVIGATLVAALVYALVNTWILAIVVAPVRSTSPWEIWKKNRDGFLIELVTLPTLGSLIPVVARQNPVGILLFIIPLAGPHLAIRTLRKVEQETQAAMAGLADAVERRDPYTYRHSVRVTDYVRDVLTELPHLPLSVSETILAAARIHDLGKVGTRDVALKKPGALDPSERLELQQHAVIGADIVSHLSMYEASAEIIRHHHEWWNGEGYPDGLREEAIPLGARIIAVADAFDAMTSDRVYRKALSNSTAMAELRKQAGRQFDPEVVAAFERSQAQKVAVPERRLAAVGGG
ncbi:MAG: HD-GYP domain-containing protein, partial [Chloroflexota bacterium]|nr:HD-GYP domain-containing protein [Chloroflexota bacterium]